MTVTLLNCRYTIVSTGGTASALESAGVAVTKVEKLTKFPEMVCWNFWWYAYEFIMGLGPINKMN